MKNTLLFLAIMLVVVGCSKNKDVYGGGEKQDTTAINNGLITLPDVWKKASGMMNGWPAGIELYHNTTAYGNKAFNGWCVVFDPAVIEFKPILPAANKKPSVAYAEESGTKYACINGGFFGTNTSYSLVQYNGVIGAVNIKSLTRTYNNVATTYYPTRGAFGVTATGIPQVAWIYNVGAGNGTMYSYPAPSPNELNKAPQQQPDAAFPSGGSVWNVNSAIGGSPVLIRNNEINVTDAAELIEIDNTSSRARSAIGYTTGNKIIVLAVEGGNSSGGIGLTLRELATLMKEMGCAGALNLDGGGSTNMIVNGEFTVKPSDAAGERAVMSMIVLKKK